MNRFIFLLLLCITCSVSADEPPDWNGFIVQSENKEWSAVVWRLGEASKPWDDEWELLVYEGYYLTHPSPDIKPVWSSSYNPSGYSGGYLSNDGNAFSYVEYWYYPDRPVVEIYRDDCIIRKNGTYFDVGNNLQKTVSHELWLKMGGELEYFESRGNLYLRIDTVKGERVVKAWCDEES